MRGLLLCIVIWAAGGGAAHGQGACVFETDDTTWRLLDDCSTDAPIVVPDGFTLDGDGHVIWVIDPPDGTFPGGVVRNAGASASVVNTTIVGLRLSSTCQSGTRRLRGIHFEGASGIIRNNTIVGISRGASPCQEGNAIEVRSLDDRRAAAVVEIAHNTIGAYQKTGIVVTGHVHAWVHHNEVGASATQMYLPANGLQIGGGALARVEENLIEGNSWPHADAAATAILLLASQRGTLVRSNTISGNADVGIYVMADGVTVAFNRVEDADSADGFYDIGIGNYGRDNLIVGNVVRGFATSYDGEVDEPPMPAGTAARQMAP